MKLTGPSLPGVVRADVGRRAPVMMMMLLSGPGVSASWSRVHYRVVIAIRRYRPRGIHGGSPGGVSLLSVQRVPRPVLRTVPAAVRIVILDDRRLFLDNVGPSTAAGHRRAQEYIDNEHDEE